MRYAVRFSSAECERIITEMPKEIPPSSFECDCGHQLDFFEGTVSAMEKMSRKAGKNVRLSDETEHVVVFHKGRMVNVICPDRKEVHNGH